MAKGGRSFLDMPVPKSICPHNDTRYQLHSIHGFYTWEVGLYRMSS